MDETGSHGPGIGEINTRTLCMENREGRPVSQGPRLGWVLFHPVTELGSYERCVVCIGLFHSGCTVALHRLIESTNTES